MKTNRLRQARQIMGLTQRELGRRCRLTQGMISAFETGRLIPGPEFLRRLAEGLNLPADVINSADNKDPEA